MSKKQLKSGTELRILAVEDQKHCGDFSGFTIGLKELFALMAHRKNKRELNAFLEKHEEYKHVDEETADIISGIIGVETYMENKERYKEKGS